MGSIMSALDVTPRSMLQRNEVESPASLRHTQILGESMDVVMNLHCLHTIFMDVTQLS